MALRGTEITWSWTSNLLACALLIFLLSPVLGTGEMLACFPKAGFFSFRTSRPPASTSGSV